jgi:hypothetical protein
LSFELFDKLQGRFPLQATVAVMPVVEPLKILALSLEIGITWKPLPPEKLFVIGIVEALYDPIAPRLSDGNKHRSNAVEEAQFDHQAKGARVTVAAPKHQRIVQLKEVRYPNGLPALQEASGDLPVLLAPLALDVDLV